MAYRQTYEQWSGDLSQIGVTETRRRDSKPLDAKRGKAPLHPRGKSGMSQAAAREGRPSGGDPDNQEVSSPQPATTRRVDNGNHGAETDVQDKHSINKLKI